MNLFGKPKDPGLKPERRAELKVFEQKTGLRFKSHGLLNRAFCHRSYVNENPQNQQNNERLEFLGDSVLGLVVSTYLFEVLPDRAEGDLAKIKSFVVSEEILSELARSLNLDTYLLIGKGEENSGGRLKKALLADCFEALIGAWYLDAGFEAARDFVLSQLVPEINRVLENRHKKDYKTLLQEFVQKTSKTYPKYVMADRVGPDHDRTFFMEVQINGVTCGAGQGKNKKEAEQNAAAEAYQRLMSDRGADPS